MLAGYGLHPETKKRVFKETWQSGCFRWLLLNLLAVLLSGCLTASAVEVATLVLRGKSAVDVYGAAITSPDQLQKLAQEIEVYFRDKDSRYADLDNDLAWQMGWFNKSLLGLERIELAPVASFTHPFGSFSITLKKVTFNQCLVLANRQGISDSFYQVFLNDELISLGGIAPPGLRIGCKLEGPFMGGRNEMRYISY